MGRVTATSVALMVTTSLRSKSACSTVTTQLLLIAVTPATESVPPLLPTVVPLTFVPFYKTTAHSPSILSTPVTKQSRPKPKVSTELLPT